MDNEINITILLLLIFITLVIGFLISFWYAIFIISKLTKMNTDIQEVKDALEAANAKVTKVAADVASLHSKIDAITAEQPTAEEWAGIKQQAATLNSTLQTVDDQTEDQVSGNLPSDPGNQG